MYVVLYTDMVRALRLAKCERDRVAAMRLNTALCELTRGKPSFHPTMVVGLLLLVLFS